MVRTTADKFFWKIMADEQYLRVKEKKNVERLVLCVGRGDFSDD